MTVPVATENAAREVPRRNEPRRAGRELLLEVVFRPLSNALASVLARVGVSPTAIVLANAATGLVAALVLAAGDPLAAALLLQLKTLLDNTDGQLARATGRVTLLGRYLDTEADLVVNAAIFVSLGYVTGQPLLAAAGFVALTLVLAVDFNMTELYREARGLSTPAPEPTGGRAERALERIYLGAFGPLDRLVRAISRRRFERIVVDERSPGRIHEARLAYVDSFSVSVLANLGLTTQLFVLGACLALGLPELYPWLAIACLAALAPLHVRAERRARAALSTPRAT
jgi:archaetidylinositol phosphate synthase